MMFLKRAYKELMDKLIEWEYHELLEHHSLKELKALQKKFEKHRKELLKALKEKEKHGERD
ncbi:MAG: hypothetical protein V1493_00780 [Candidatus Diapherotrites archaeon]